MDQIHPLIYAVVDFSFRGLTTSTAHWNDPQNQKEEKYSPFLLVE